MARNANTASHPLDLAKTMLDDGGGQEAMTRALGYAMVGIGQQLAHLIRMVEEDMASSDQWRQNLNKA